MATQEQDHLKVRGKRVDDLENSRVVILKVRKMMGLRTTTEAQWEQMEYVIGQIMLMGHEDIKDIAYATLIEMTRRKFYMILLWGKQKK